MNALLDTFFNKTSLLVVAFILAGCTTNAPHELSLHEDDMHHHEDELLVLNPPENYEQTLPEMGLSLIGVEHMKSLDIKLYHLKIDDAAHPFEARQTHLKKHPSVIVDVHHHFEQHATKKIDKTYTGRRAATWNQASPKCGKGIRLGMVDGGVDTKHAAFKSSKLTYKSFHLKGQTVGASHHGTAVANVLVGNWRWGGLLPDAELFAANVFHKRKKGVARASTKSILRAINWLTDQNVDVINFSIGGSFNSLIEHAIQKASTEGILLVASAGNNGPFTKKKSYPAAYDQTIAIAASDRFNRSAKFSSAGSYVEFTAPGVSIWTAVPGGGKAMSGTSFSAPIVASFVAAATKLQGHKNLEDVRSHLKANARDRGKKGWDKYTGWGIVDIKPPC